MKKIASYIVRKRLNVDVKIEDSEHEEPTNVVEPLKESVEHVEIPVAEPIEENEKPPSSEEPEKPEEPVKKEEELVEPVEAVEKKFKAPGVN